MFSETIKTFYIKITSGVVFFLMWKMCIKIDLKYRAF